MRRHIVDYSPLELIAQFTSTLLMACMLIGLTDSNSWAQNDKPTLEIVSESLEPFEYMQDGQPAGINVKITSIILEEMGIPYTFNIQENSGIRAMELAKQGKADAILSVSFKEDRTSFLIYPEGFDARTKADNFMWVSEYVCYIRTEDQNKIEFKSLQQLADADYKIGVIEGVSYTPEFWDAGLNTIKAKNEEINFEKLLDGDIDIVVTDRTIGRATVKSMGIRDQVEELNKKVFQKMYTMAMVKDSDYPNKEEFLDTFFQRLDLLKRSGKAREIYLNYIY